MEGAAPADLLVGGEPRLDVRLQIADELGLNDEGNVGNVGRRGVEGEGLVGWEGWERGVGEALGRGVWGRVNTVRGVVRGVWGKRTVGA